MEDKQSKLEKIAFKKRAEQSNQYIKEKDYYSDYDNILENSRLTKIAKKERHTTHPEYDVIFENEYDGRDYTKEYNEVLTNSRLKNDSDDIRETPHAKEFLVLDEYSPVEPYTLESVKKGNPEDGGHIHSIPSNAYSDTAIIPQLATYEGGDEKDVLQRNYLLGINKYERIRSYGPGSVDCILNENEGQYFMP